MSDAWFTQHIAPDGNAESGGCHPQEAAALKNYLRSKTMTAQEAARAITAAIKPESDPIKEFKRLWPLLIDALKDLYDKRTKIIQLLQAIQTLPSTGDIDWNDLHFFSHLWCSRWDDDLCQASLKWNTKRQQEVNRMSLNDATMTDVVAAKNWIVVAGQLGNIQVGQEFRMNGEYHLCPTHVDVSADRRRFWKKRLTDIKYNTEVEQDIRNAARTALAAMALMEVNIL